MIKRFRLLQLQVARAATIGAYDHYLRLLRECDRL